MIRGSHVVLYSADAPADRAFFRDVLDFSSVDAGHGWLIFALPPAEVAIHPAEAAGHELFLTCDDITGFIANMTERGVACSSPTTQRWGTMTHLTLPGGGTVGVYEPTHAVPTQPADQPARS